MATGRPGRLTRGCGSNGAGNDEDGGQHDRKCSEKTNVFYYDVGRKELTITATATMWFQRERLKVI